MKQLGQMSGRKAHILIRILYYVVDVIFFSK